MSLGNNETLRGDEVIDGLQGIQMVVADKIWSLPDVEARAAYVKQVIPILNLANFASRRYQVESGRAFSEVEESVMGYNDALRNVRFIGRTGNLGRMFKYLYDQDVPLDQVGVLFYNPILLDYEIEHKLDDPPKMLKVPVLDILSCINAEPDLG